MVTSRGVLLNLPYVVHATERGEVLDGGAWEAEGTREDVTHVRSVALQTRESQQGEDAVDLQGVNESSTDITEAARDADAATADAKG